MFECLYMCVGACIFECVYQCMCLVLVCLSVCVCMCLSVLGVDTVVYATLVNPAFLTSLALMHNKTDLFWLDPLTGSIY